MSFQIDLFFRDIHRNSSISSEEHNSTIRQQPVPLMLESGNDLINCQINNRNTFRDILIPTCKNISKFGLFSSMTVNSNWVLQLLINNTAQLQFVFFGIASNVGCFPFYSEMALIFTDFQMGIYQAIMAFPLTIKNVSLTLFQIES